MSDPSDARLSPATSSHVAPAVLTSMLVNGVAPYAVYAMARPHWSEVRSLVLSGILPGALEVVSLVRHRRLDPLSTVNLAALSLSLLLALTGGSAHVLLLKESLVTGAIGMGFLGSLGFERPAIFYLGRQLVTGNLPDRLARFDATWNASPAMRATLRAQTAVWGATMVGELVVRVLLIPRLSTKQMLVVGPVVFNSMLFGLIAWTVRSARRNRPLIEKEGERKSADASPVSAR